MTTTEKSSRKVIVGAGWANPLTHDFMIENASYVHVFADDVELVNGVDYTVTNVLNPAGYAVTIAVPGSWAPTSWVLDARPPVAQAKDLTSGGTFGVKYEDGLDQLARRVQRVYDLAKRAVKMPLDTVVGADYIMPAPAANKVIRWNAAGIALENATLAETTVPFPATANRFLRNDAAGVPTAISAAATTTLDAIAALTTAAFGRSLLTMTTAALAFAAVANTSAFVQASTGGFSIDQATQPRIHKMADRLFLDGAATFNGQFLNGAMVGLSADTLALHSWGPRDASMFVDSSVAGMAIVGHAESNKFAGWSGTSLPAIPSSIGVSGFAINNRVGGNGQAWGGYFDAVRLTNGFTVGVEITMANFGSESTITPFNVKTGGADGGVSVWTAIGCGLDAVAYPGAIKDIAAGYALLSSYAANTAKARTGFVIADGALRDRSGGSFVYEAFAVPERHQFAWYRASDQTAAAFIWADVITGSAVGITMKTGGVEITGGGTLVNNIFLGLQATGQAPYLAAGGADTNVSMSFFTKGTGGFLFNTNSAAPVTQFGIAHTASAVNTLQATGAVTTAAPILSAVGTDTNIGISLATKGTGVHSFFTNSTVKQFEVAHVATAVNCLQAKGAVTTGSPVLSAIGTDTNIGISIATKGTGSYSFLTNTTAKQFEILHVASAVNYLSATGGAAAAGVALSALGSDTNISLSIQAKGSGSIFLNARSLIAFQIDSAASAVNRMAVINAATAGQPMLYVTGTDANVSGLLQGQGTGGWQFKDGATNKKFEYNTTGIGFFAATPVVKQTVGAALSTGGAETNVNLATRINELRTALINYGLAA